MPRAAAPIEESPTPAQAQALVASRPTHGEQRIFGLLAWVVTPIVVLISWFDMPGVGFWATLAIGVLIMLTGLGMVALVRRGQRRETVASFLRNRFLVRPFTWVAWGWGAVAALGLAPRVVGLKLPLAYANLLVAGTWGALAVFSRRRYRRYDTALADAADDVSAPPEVRPEPR